MVACAADALQEETNEKTNRLLEAVMATVGATPDAPAYQLGSESPVSYGKLWECACRIAWELLDRVPGHSPALVYGGKSPLMVASFLGCLMSGRAFVPVDLELPVARVHNIASQIDNAVLLSCADVPEELTSDLEAACVIDVRRLLGSRPHTKATLAAPPREHWVRGEDTNYIIFTSGSTGRPKGIEVSVTDVGNFMRWMKGFPVVRDGGRVFLDQAHYSFDLSEYELVGALSTGGCLHAVSGELASSHKTLFADLAGSGVEVWVSTPSFADFCLVDKTFGENLLPQAKLFLFCGEELRHATAAQLRERFPRAVIANTYGPTESTVAVTYVEVGDADLASDEPLPVGMARPGTELRIQDRETGAPCPVGASGEIVIVGDTVAKGYYRNPEKTAASFFETQMSDGTPARGYRTGDRGHLDEQGMLHCEGRFDSLVKLNGFRIELEEIEGCLEEEPSVSQAVVLPVMRDGRVRSLRAYVVFDERPAGADFDLARELKSHLARRLPSYMVPRSVRILEHMPLTPNEKVDRKALQVM